MKRPSVGMILDEFIIQEEKGYPNASGDLSKLLRDIGLASKIINREVNKAGLVDILGKIGKENIQGEEVFKLDEFANDTLISFLKNGGQCAGVASEEEDDIKVFENEEAKDAHYLVLFDPLDGSSNIDTNASIGTIFSVVRRLSSDKVTQKDFFQKGRNLVAAGYVLYGSSTMLVYSTGNGVNGFTLDPSIGEFCLSHYQIKTPENAKQFSVNYGNHRTFDNRLIQFVDWCTEDDKETSRPLTMRYIGSMVADFHRNLLKGGIFIYPANAKSPKGKLRLLYECIPLAYLQEHAGGSSTDMEVNILDIEPNELHQRTPIALGSKNLVAKFLSF
jgi:fructose-1,6-bisphosphatase I